MGVKGGEQMRELEEEEEEGGRKTVLVGVKMDADGRELLTWALVKIARAGDHVVALHVLPSAAPVDSFSLDASARFSSLLSLVKNFEAELAAYSGFCELKRIELEMKVARGSSVRRVLVKEATAHGASKVVVGVAKRSKLHSPTSVAKYCARKLTPDCSVFAASNAKILFKREAARQIGNCIIAVCTISPPPNSIRMHLISLAFKFNEEPMRSQSTLQNDGESKEQAMVNTPTRTEAHSECSSPTAAASSTFHVDGESKNPKKLELQDKYSSICRSFSYKDAIRMSSDFSTENLIGRGGSSRVYRGCLPDGQQLALKILTSPEDAADAFVSEIEMMASLHHKNIVSLLGFCPDDDKLILMYNLLSRGSLEDNLHRKNSKLKNLLLPRNDESIPSKKILPYLMPDSKNALGWAERYKVAVGVADALQYLHGDGGAASVIHRDVKSSNILLSDDFEPQLADFGLAIWASASETQLTCTDVAGTFGYLAPEYFMHGKVNEKLDVYAFGVVLLELVSGRKPVGLGCPKESLVMWAMPILQSGKLEELVDPYLGDSHEEDQLERMALAAFLCIRRSPRYRPPMALVLKILQGDDSALRWARSQVVSSVETSEVDDEALLQSNDLRAHIDLVLQDIDDDDDSSSISSIEPPTANMSLEEYLRRRWSRSSSFD